LTVAALSDCAPWPRRILAASHRRHVGQTCSITQLSSRCPCPAQRCPPLPVLTAVRSGYAHGRARAPAPAPAPASGLGTGTLRLFT